MNEADQVLEQELQERLRFEALMSELAARFIHLAADQLDGAIEQSQRELCEELGLDRSALFQRSDDATETLWLTHLYQRAEAGGPATEERVQPDSGSRLIVVREETVPLEVYTQVDAKASFPWIYEQLRQRQTIVIPEVELLPVEAAVDQRRLQGYGTKSTVVVPLFLEKNWLGCLTFAALRQQHQWPRPVVRRLEFVADVFTSALARKHAEQQLRSSEQRFRALVEQAGDGFELLDQAGRYLDVNAATVQQLGYTREEMLQLTVFNVDPAVKPEKFAQLEEALAKSSPVRLESVHQRKDGSTFPVEITISGIRLNGSPCFLTLVRDITERKQAEEQLSRSWQEITQLKEQLRAERDYLREEVKLSQAHGEIIGRSEGIKRVLQQVEQVAPADCPVLVSGETGTGKELIAQEIHRVSRRREQMMVLVNCAALPAGLIESELFGRERGAYTGALTSQVGRFELANGSTVFLDEVGELSLEVQAKLLRVLQQGEFERLGSPKTHKVDARVIAATNRDLAAEVRQGKFREDLYYRLKVFPIEIPPLRERVSDIPLLVFAFMEEFSKRMGKKITKVPRRAMQALQEHSWPGNVRELRNVIEHSVILSSGEVLKLSVLGDTPTPQPQPQTLAEAEREHILRTLESTAWRIKGPHGAAPRLGLQPSTLYSRMQKLGIPHRRQKDAMAIGAEGL